VAGEVAEKTGEVPSEVAETAIEVAEKGWCQAKWQKRGWARW